MTTTTTRTGLTKTRTARRALADKLGREPTDAELIAEVRRILRESAGIAKATA